MLAEVRPRSMAEPSHVLTPSVNVNCSMEFSLTALKIPSPYAGTKATFFQRYKTILTLSFLYATLILQNGFATSFRWTRSTSEDILFFSSASSKALGEELSKMFDDIAKVNYNVSCGKRHAVNDLKNNKIIEVKRDDKGGFSHDNE